MKNKILKCLPFKFIKQLKHFCNAIILLSGVNQSYLMPTPVCADDCCENTEDNYERNNHTVKEQNSISDKIWRVKY